MKKIRFWWWLLTAFAVKHKKTVLYAAIASIVIALIVPRLLPYLPRQWRAETIGIVGKFRPEELPSYIAAQLSYGLTATDEFGQAIPALATGWTINEAGTEYTFSIDAERQWNDGTPVSSKDIRVSIANVVIEMPDAKTIVFKLQEPYAPFPVMLSRPLFKSGFVGLGPSSVAQIKKNGEYVESISIVGADKNLIRYRFYRTSQEMITALKLGEIATIENMSSAKDVPKWKTITIEENLNQDRYTAIFFNTQDSSLGDKSFRQALTYAIPNKSTGDIRAISPIDPRSWAYNPQVKQYITDQKQARDLLKSVFEEKELPSLELTTFLPYLDRAEEIAKAWTELGVRTQVKVANSAPSEFQTLLIGQQIPPDPDQYLLWHSTQTETNISHYSSPKVDKLLEDGRKTLDQNKRIDIYRDFQRFLLEDCPAAFLDHVTTYTVKRK